MVARQKTNPVQTVQELEFALVEMNLYLDTHPGDANALAAFNNLATSYAMARSNYETQAGPLINFGVWALLPPGPGSKSPGPGRFN